MKQKTDWPGLEFKRCIDLNNKQQDVVTIASWLQEVASSFLTMLISIICKQHFAFKLLPKYGDLVTFNVGPRKSYRTNNVELALDPEIGFLRYNKVYILTW